MLIDWSTVIFQFVNFLILMALLKKFLFGRVVQAMDDREAEISERLDTADQERRKAEELKEEYEQKNRRIEEERREKLEQAEKEAEEKKAELSRQARDEIDAQKERWKKSLDEEQDSFLRRFRTLAATQVFETSRKVLSDLTDVELEERAADKFIGRLSELKDEDRRAMVERLKKSGEKALVRSGFELTDSVRSKIAKGLQERLDSELEVEFETDSELIMGLVLRGEGFKAAWSVQDYLGDLEKEGLRALGSVGGSEAAAGEAGG